MIEWLQTRLGISPELQLRLFATLATIVGLWLMHRIALGLVYRRVRDPWGRYRWRKGLTYVLVAAGVVIVGRMWFVGVQALATFLGLLSAGLAIALKDPVGELAGRASIIWPTPFGVGHPLQTGPHTRAPSDLGRSPLTLNEIG